MELGPEYEEALRKLKKGTLTKGGGGEQAENSLGQVYQRLVAKGLAPRLRGKYQGRRYKSAGTSKGGQSGKRPANWLGKTAPPTAGRGEGKKV